MTLLEMRPGFVLFQASGARAASVFREEAGGHRWMRVPPGEKRGRVHTSTVTVAVLEEVRERDLVIPEKDLEISVCRGSGAGGQHRNKTESAVVMKHVPTGITVRCESERSQIQNRASALEVLRARLQAAQSSASIGARNDARRGQIGAGSRGERRRTVRVMDEQVVDHVTGRAWTLREYLRGAWAQ